MDSRSYLDANGVEMKLADAMKIILNERPTDPLARISKLIVSPKIVKEAKSYMFPLREDRTDDVLCVNPGSVPCRVCMYVIKAFDLPVDICGIDFAKDLNSPELLSMNPIHSIPFLAVKKSDGDTVGINGSEAILDYLCTKYSQNVPDAFIPCNLIERAQAMEKVHFISGAVYRATMYQYVYPCMGLMTECQYDLCKRDFALGIVEQWCKVGAIGGAQPTLSDFWLASLHAGCCMTGDAAFDSLPIKWERDLLPKYPSLKAAIQKTLSLKCVQSINNTPLGENAMDIDTFNQSFAAQFLANTLPGKGREFCYQFEDGMVHPNAVSYVPGMKDVFDKPIP